MSTPKAAPLTERFRGLAREIIKFGAVGGLGVLVNFGVFNLLRSTTDLQTVRANVIAIVVAIITNYIGFRYFTYRDRDLGGRRREMFLFVLFSGIGMVIESGVLYAATYGFGWDSSLQNNVFKFLGMGVATVFRFWSYRTWVFKALPTPAVPSLVVEQRDGHEAPVTALAPEPAATN
ncbi:GtrA family protein [Streptomyces sp. NPDC054904]|uniref:GtrA family protein n=1 Tax=unclassified Streptomyces TaxID=2593676 RepID=UPI002481EF21|nr:MULTISPECIES: GtrA family protein [unclassified Streptomyces]MDA5281891.1 GtrA family protein [Streptomyces sp. Isolate_45]MDX2395824.1 GtrA family protein [Streptomyces sp. DK15]